jgi:hypothetical protein
VRAEAGTLRQHGLEVVLGASRPVLLPHAGRELYRGLRALLAEAADGTEGGRLKLAVVDLPGKSHVEVMAIVAGRQGARVHSRAFPRCVRGSLGLGFAEC